MDDPYPSNMALEVSDVVEEAPSHDGTPCFSAWECSRAADPQYRHLEPGTRPKYSIQIYDTTPGSGNLEHLKALAGDIHKGTCEHRTLGNDSDWNDRLDVYSLAMPHRTPLDDRVRRCIAHQKAEIVSRNLSGRSDFYISGTYRKRDHRRVLFIVAREVEPAAWERDQDADAGSDEWDPDTWDGPLCAVFWGFPEMAIEERERYGLGLLGPRIEPMGPGELADYILQDVKVSMGWFQQCYIGERRMEREIARYVKVKEEHGDTDVDWEWFPEGEGVRWIEPELGAASEPVGGGVEKAMGA